MRLTLASLVLIPALAIAAPAPAPAAAPTAAATDPHLWLEGVTDEKALAWVRERNAVSVKELAETPGFKQLEGEILAILDSDKKIPFVNKIGDHYYNLWKDKDHKRGLWRRTTLAEYKKAEPKWETVIDVDALGQAEGENWVWAGAAAAGRTTASAWSNSRAAAPTRPWCANSTRSKSASSSAPASRCRRPRATSPGRWSPTRSGSARTSAPAA
jgi:hypothetical protein